MVGKTGALVVKGRQGWGGVGKTVRRCWRRVDHTNHALGNGSTTRLTAVTLPRARQILISVTPEVCNVSSAPPGVTPLAICQSQPLLVYRISYRLLVGHSNGRENR